MKKLTLFAVVFAASVLFNACSGGKKKAEDKKQVTIAMVNWIECIANTNLAKAVLEEKGYDVKLINADVAPVFAAVAKGNADLFMEVWEPITHKPRITSYNVCYTKLLRKEMPTCLWRFGSQLLTSLV